MAKHPHHPGAHPNAHEHGSYHNEHHGGPMAGHAAGGTGVGPGDSHPASAVAELCRQHPEGDNHPHMQQPEQMKAPGRGIRQRPPAGD